MLYGLDLFSGIGGNSLALTGYVHNIAYCEADRHAQAVLLSRMHEGKLPRAPICTDVTKLDGRVFRRHVDIISAGFPCQDISCAGKGAGLDGERSGLFFQILRLAKEIQPAFLFLENVPAIRTRGLDRVIQELTACGYDLRWTMLSAADVGAPHKRERWFCLARRQLPNASFQFNQSKPGSLEKILGKPQNETGRTNSLGADVANACCRRCSEPETGEMEFAGRTKAECSGKTLANPKSQRRGKRWTESEGFERSSSSASRSVSKHTECDWPAEPNVGRVVNGLPHRVDRIKRLGNAVVPAQARKAFEMLMGVNHGVFI